jgi:FlaA1/EpsC-like NDP-sugar epimerase
MHNIRLELEEKFPQVEFTPVMGDVRMVDRVESVFRRFHPQIVFHAAAYKHVPLMEENPCEAVHTNVYGTHNVADMAVKYDVDKFIMISTDKAVNPTNVMGASKRLAEIYVQSLSVAISKGLHSGKTRFITTRFGNVLGSNGSVIPRFREQLAKGGPLTVTHPDIIRYFMTIPEACRLVLEAAFMGKGNEIFVFDMGTPVKIADLARRMIELAGLVPDKDIEIQYTGLRPGEKLYEELLAIKENTLPTLNEKIYRAQVREYDFKEINELMDPLVHLAVCVDKVRTVKLMKEIVPEFKSKNSEYEALDK